MKERIGSTDGKREDGERAEVLWRRVQQDSMVRREIGRVVTLPGPKKRRYEHMVQRHYALLVQKAQLYKQLMYRSLSPDSAGDLL